MKKLPVILLFCACLTHLSAQEDQPTPEDPFAMMQEQMKQLFEQLEGPEAGGHIMSDSLFFSFPEQLPGMDGIGGPQWQNLLREMERGLIEIQPGFQQQMEKMLDYFQEQYPEWHPELFEERGHDGTPKQRRKKRKVYTL